MSSNERPPAVQIAVIVAVTFCVISAIALIFGVNAVLDREQYDRIPGILTSALGVIGPTIIGLLALLRSQEIKSDLHNGLLEAKVRQALDNAGVTRSAQRSNDANDQDRRQGNG